MPEMTPDTEALIALRERVKQHQESLELLDRHSRDHAVQLAKITTNIEGLQQNHRELLAAIDEVKRQQATYQEHTAQQFLNLDNKVDAGNSALRDHFDEKFDAMRSDVTQTMDKKEAAVPQWAQVRLTALSILVAILGVVVAILGYFRVI